MTENTITPESISATRPGGPRPPVGLESPGLDLDPDLSLLDAPEPRPGAPARHGRAFPLTRPMREAGGDLPPAAGSPPSAPATPEAPGSAAARPEHRPAASGAAPPGARGPLAGPDGKAGPPRQASAGPVLPPDGGAGDSPSG
ncbi:MAG: hypothetical protein LBQ12_07475, partial [Deltaproteobacteria bacterium]|nr:hypothetical protein [Deltaproteobacteria bacterium]